MNMNKNFISKISPGYISGLSQTDGSFSCGISNLGKKISLIPNFTITADLSSKHVLDEIKKFFDCGRINISITNNTASYIVTDRKSLKNIIIPHFQNYPLFCYKLHAFNLFTKIVEGVDNKNNKNIEGLRKLINMALSMNLGSFRNSDRIKEIYSALGYSEIDRPLPLIPYTIINLETPLNDDFIAGIIDGDGSFWVSFQKDGNIRTGFSITMDTASIPLLNKIKERFNGIGSIQKKKETYSYYYVHGINQILNNLIPFMDNNHLLSERALHYEIFRKVSLMLGSMKPLNLETKLEIVEFAYNSNKEGKRRQVNKEDYIEILRKLNIK